MATERYNKAMEMLRNMEEIMRTKGVIPIKYGMEFLDYGFNLLQGYEEMEKSRDNWKKKALSKKNEE